MEKLFTSGNDDKILKVLCNKTKQSEELKKISDTFTEEEEHSILLYVYFMTAKLKQQKMKTDLMIMKLDNLVRYKDVNLIYYDEEKVKSFEYQTNKKYIPKMEKLIKEKKKKLPKNVRAYLLKFKESNEFFEDENLEKIITSVADIEAPNTPECLEKS